MSKIDEDCQELCKALNSIDGIVTTSSCCGHGKKPYGIWFKAENLECLPDLLYWFDGCHSGFYGWQVTVSTDCAKSPVTFCVKGPTGKQAFDGSEEIALLIRKDVAAIAAANKE